MVDLSKEWNQKQIKNIDKCQTVSQRAIPASSIIFHQARKQFAALKLENKSSPTSCKKPITNVQIPIKSIGVTPIQTLPPFQNKIPILKISPSINTVMLPKCDNSAVIKAKVPESAITPRTKVNVARTPKKTVKKDPVVKSSQTPKLPRVKTAASPYSQNSQKHTALQHTAASSSRSLIKKVNMPLTLRTKPGASYISSASSSPRSQMQQKSETKKTETKQEAQKRQPGAIKVISVNALNARQPRIITTENIPNKPLRLAPSLSKPSDMSKTNCCSSPSNKSSLKPFASVTNLVSHGKFGKPVSFVASNTNNESDRIKRI